MTNIEQLSRQQSKRTEAEEKAFRKVTREPLILIRNVQVTHFLSRNFPLKHEKTTGNFSLEH